jgi:hypothetical protein
VRGLTVLMVWRGSSGVVVLALVAGCILDHVSWSESCTEGTCVDQPVEGGCARAEGDAIVQLTITVPEDITACVGVRVAEQLQILGTEELCDQECGGFLRTEPIAGNEQLRSLDGLTVERASSLTVLGTSALVDISALSTASWADGMDLGIAQNVELVEFDGLALPPRVDTIYVGENLRLVDVDGLAGVEEADRVFIRSNIGLQSIAGLSTLRRASLIEIADNAQLASLDGLDALTHAGALTLQHNPQLDSLTGLEALETIGGSLIITDLPSLRTLAGLESLITVAGDVRLDYVGQLPLDEVEALVARVQIGGRATVCGYLGAAADECAEIEPE